MQRDMLQQLIYDTLKGVGSPTGEVDPVILQIGSNFVNQVKLLTPEQKLAIKNFLHDNGLV